MVQHRHREEQPSIRASDLLRAPIWDADITYMRESEYENWIRSQRVSILVLIFFFFNFFFIYSRNGMNCIHKDVLCTQNDENGHKF